MGSSLSSHEDLVKEATTIVDKLEVWIKSANGTSMSDRAYFNYSQEQFKEVLKKLASMNPTDSVADRLVTRFSKVRHAWSKMVAPACYDYGAN